MEKSARLVKLTTDDGLVEMNDNIKIGKVYTVYPGSIRVVKSFNFVRMVMHEKEWIDVLCPDGVKGLIPTELLEILE